jgi:hypothetical protein
MKSGPLLALPFSIGIPAFHNEEFHNLYLITIMMKSRRIRWERHVARLGENRNAYRILVRKPEGKRLSGRPRRKWEDNIEMDLRQIRWGVMDWIDVAQDTK